MRIVIDARYLRGEYSGIGVYSEGLLQALGRQDHVNEYFALVHSSYREDLELPDNFEIIEDHAPPVSMRTLLGVGRVVEDLRADILHSLFPLAPVFWSGKRVVTVHDLQPLTDPQFTAMRSAPARLAYDAFYRLAYPYSMRRAEVLVADSFATKETIRHLYPDLAGRTLVIHAGVPAESFEVPTEEQVDQVRERFDIPERFLFYIGSTRPNKNLEVMLEAFEEYLRQHPEETELKWVMVLKQDRFFDPLFARIRDRGLLRRIHIHEQVSELEKRVFYRLASLLYFVTKHEGFGLPVLEAQAQGLPVLISTHGALAEVAGRAALTCDPDNRDSIVAGLEQFFSGPDLRERLVLEGKQNVQRFSWDKAARELLDLYTHVLT